MLLETLVEVSREIGSTRSRTRKIALLTDALARLAAAERDIGIAYLAGEPRQSRLELGPAAVMGLEVAPADAATLTLTDVDAALQAIAHVPAGAGSRTARIALLVDLLGRGTTDEQGWLRALVLRELRQGSLEGLLIQAIARAGDEIRVSTRSLQEITQRVPEVVDAARSLAVDDAVLDGEAIAFDTGGRPRPFQETMRRIGREHDTEVARREVPLAVRFFDLLHRRPGRADQPLRARREALERVVPDALRVEGMALHATDLDAATAFLARVLGAGHEGAMVKDLDAPYEAGRRGASWRKLKPVHTLDLVVLAAEWGSGRRSGWLSNLHLGARADDDERSDNGLTMLGKTFKGLTDEVLAWQTEQLLARETHRAGQVVYVRPELVVEIALDGLVRSTRYPGGLALRFARVRGYRTDRSAAEADTMATARAIHRGERLPTG